MQVQINRQQRQWICWGWWSVHRWFYFIGQWEMFITASTEGTCSLRNLITNLASELKDSSEADKPVQKYASFLNIFNVTKSRIRLKHFWRDRPLKPSWIFTKNGNQETKSVLSKQGMIKHMQSRLTISQGFVKCLVCTLISKRELQTASVHLVKSQLEI